MSEPSIPGAERSLVMGLLVRVRRLEEARLSPRGDSPGRRKLVMLALALGYLLGLAGLELLGLSAASVAQLSTSGLLALAAAVGGNAAEHYARRPGGGRT